MKKLIKVKEHFYVVDDSDIREMDYILCVDGIWKNQVGRCHELPVTEVWRKITHSTQNLYGVKYLNLSEVESVVNVLELNKDRVFTIEDIETAFEAGIVYGEERGETQQECFDRLMEELQPKNEWNVEISEEYEHDDSVPYPKTNRTAYKIKLV